jgi:hypothetical protein
VNDAHVQARLAALQAAVDLHVGTGAFRLQPGVDRTVTIAAAENAVRHTADIFWAWAVGTTHLQFTTGPVFDQVTGTLITPATTGDPMSQITDGDKSSITVSTKDAKGFETSDAVSWDYTPNDGSVITSEVSEDGKTFSYVGVAPGTVQGTLTDSAPEVPLSVSFVIDVVPDGTATITLTDGPVERQ